MLRGALEARIWEDRVREFDKLEASLRELRRYGHDVNNALSAALLSSQLFSDATHSDAPLSDDRSALVSSADAMVDALRRLKLLMESERRPETTVVSSSSLIQPVELVPAVDECVGRARTRHRGAELIVRDLGPDDRRVRVSVCGGREGFARAFAAVLDNACAGNGVRMRPCVEVRFGLRREVDVVVIEVTDDGPGFAKEVLEMPIVAFETTRPGALGLGLYTAERIARASGGSLRRANAESGGAVVSLFLPVAAESASPQ